VAGRVDALGEMPMAIPFGGASLPLFNKKGVLKLGRRRLLLTRNIEGSALPSVSSARWSTAKQRDPFYPIPPSEHVEHLDRMIRRYDQRELPAVGWLDKLTLKRIQRIQTADIAVQPSEENNIYLTIEFPGFKHPVVYHQRTCNPELPEILPFSDKDRLFVLHDPERENPVEAKYTRLMRSSKGLQDRDRKANAAERKRIEAIVAAPHKRLTPEEKALLWQFRFSITDNKKALTKFLRIVDWQNPAETAHALELLQQWAPVDIADALELLSGHFTNEKVREYAVQQLQRADDEELSNYLLQLVQALRYEPKYPSPLSEFLINRACRNFNLANFFHWYLSVERFDKVKGPMFQLVHQDFLDVLSKTEEGEAWERALQAQGRLVQRLVALCETAKAAHRRVDKKIEHMKRLLDTEFKDLKKLDKPVGIAVRPDVMVTGIIPEETKMFKSALAPLLACFQTTTGQKYKVIFKSGDDLRQDQLVIQMINLMDSLLKKVNLDLQLTPYRVLATAPSAGFVEFVPDSFELSAILDKFGGDIRKFFEHHHPRPQALRKVLDTFVKSTAGYCVITYILGVGDRHLDNLMLTTDGHLFHIDFGFILGHDPKPWPPPIKFCKEMVSANHWDLSEIDYLL